MLMSGVAEGVSPPQTSWKAEAFRYIGYEGRLPLLGGEGGEGEPNFIL